MPKPFVIGHSSRKAYKPKAVVSHGEVKAFNALPSREKGYGKKWEKASIAYRHANPLCVNCKAHGLVTPSQLVDHIIPHLGDDKLFWDMANWQALCQKCHRRKTNCEEADWRVYYPVDLHPASCDLTVIFGSPASGKSWLASRGGFDTVVDLDEIAIAMYGVRSDGLHTDEQRFKALGERNQQLAYLTPDKGRAVFVSTAGKTWQKEKLLTALQPKRWCTLIPPVSTVLDRIMADPARQAVPIDMRVKMVKDWYINYSPLEGEIKHETTEAVLQWVSVDFPPSLTK